VNLTYARCSLGRVRLPTFGTFGTGSARPTSWARNPDGADSDHQRQPLAVGRGERLGAVTECAVEPFGGGTGLGHQLVRIAEPALMLDELVLVTQFHEAGRPTAHHVQIEVDQVDCVALPPGRARDVAVHLTGARWRVEHHGPPGVVRYQQDEGDLLD